MTPIGEWLELHGFGDFAGAFQRERIDLDILPELTDADLKDLGLPIGPRRKLLSLIRESHPAPDPAEPAPPPRAAPGAEAERRHLTVMFCDLVGSTALSAASDPEDMRDVLQRYQGVCAAAVAHFDGFLAKFMGDGVLAYFGYPQAQEDAAERAVRAGLEIVAAVSQMHSPAGGALAAHVGIASGLVVVGDLVGEGAAQEQAVIGDAPNEAARLQELAGPGQVVITEATRRLLGANFEYEDLGRHEFKGGDGSINMIAVTGERAVSSRFEALRDQSAPLVGRKLELALLREAWSVAKSGEGQAVLLTGDAGIGKSRIVRALIETASVEPHVSLRYQCSPYHRDSALWPVIQQLNETVRNRGDEPGPAVLDRVERLVTEAAGDTGRMASLIASLIGLNGDERYGKLDLTPQAQRNQTLDALTDLAIGLAARAPALVVVEDAHWIDPTTFELVERMISRISEARVLLVVTSRPERRPEFSRRPYLSALTIDRLRQASARSIIAGLGGDSLPAETVDAIIARTDGVPLFVEELTKAVLETGETSVPASLQDSLMARLDHLPEVKEIVQCAAVIGREVDLGLLSSVMDRSEKDLETGLDRLVDADLLLRQDAGPHPNYFFKHTLVQDAAYASLLKSRRRELHERIARAIEREFPDVAAAEPEIIARHFTKARRFDEAVPLWRLAGERALTRVAQVEAIAHLTQGLDVLERMPESPERDARELDLRSTLGLAWMALKGWCAPEVNENFDRALLLARTVGDMSALGRIHYGMWGGVLTEGRFADALDLSRQIMANADDGGDQNLRVVGHATACTTHYWLGEFEDSVEQGRLALSAHGGVAQPQLTGTWNVDPLTDTTLYVCLSTWILGYPDQAAAACETMDTHVRRRGHPFDIAFALSIGCLLWDFRREPDRILARAEEAAQIGREHGLPFVVDVLAPIFRGVAWLREGRQTEGVRELRTGVDRWTAGGAGGMTPYLHAVLAEGMALTGDVAGGLAVIDGALSQIARPRWRERAHLAEILRLKGWMLELLDDFDAAERAYRESLDVAHEQNAKSWRLRTSTDLARLWRSQGKAEEATALLTPAYQWFSEGFETSDLLRARRFLEAS